MNTEKTRRRIYGLNLIVLLIAMFIVLGVVNWLATRHYKRWDLAKPTTEALSDQTIKTLKNLTGDVSLTYFYTYSADEESSRMMDDWKELLERYKSVSKRFSYEMIDYAKNPQRVNQFFKGNKKITLDSNSSIVKSGEYVEKVSENTESALTSAIIKVTRGQMRTVCFTGGHGEHDPDEQGTGGYYKAAEGLRRENFNVKNINLIKEGVPEACTVVAIAGPVLPFKPEESAVLEKWLENSGKLLVMLDPTGRTGLESLLDKYMIVPEDDVLKTEESAAAGSDPFYVMADTYSSTSKITESLSQLGVLVDNQVRAIPTYMYDARSLKTKDDILDKVKIDIMITTDDNVRVLPSGESPHASRFQQVRSESGAVSEGAGPGGALGEVGAQTVAVSSIKGTDFESFKSTEEAVKFGPTMKKSTRLVVFGDSDFAADGFIEQIPNGDLFLNSVSWLAEEEKSIGIRPKPNKFTPIHFAGGRNWFILISVLLIVPLVMLLNGIIVWRDKKRM